MIAAMERALKDGMQVLNMSIGSVVPVAAVPDRRRGVPSRGSRHGGRRLDRQQRHEWPVCRRRTGPGREGHRYGVLRQYRRLLRTRSRFRRTARAIGYHARHWGAASLRPRERSRWRAPEPPRRPNDACAALPAGSLTGKVALIRRGTCSFYIKSVERPECGSRGQSCSTTTHAAIHYSDGAGQPLRSRFLWSRMTQTDGALIDGRIAGGPASADLGCWQRSARRAPPAT